MLFEKWSLVLYALFLGGMLGFSIDEVFPQNLVMTPVGVADVGRHPESLTVGDFNQDGSLDIATVNSDSNNVSILLGNGNGTFQSAVSFKVGKSPMFLKADDLNQDGLLDLVVAGTGSDQIIVLLGRGNGVFEPGIYYHSGKGPTFLGLDDLDLDGDLDVVVINSGRFGYYPPYSLAIYLNDGHGQLGIPRMFEEQGSEGLFPTAVSIADLTNDGLPDLAVTWSQPSWRTANGFVLVLENLGKGNFTRRQKIQAGLTLSALIQKDLDQDGNLDLITASVFTDSLNILLQESIGKYTKPAQLEVGFSPVAIRSSDLDGDGNPDLVATNRTSNSASILLGKGDGSFRQAGHYAIGVNPTGLSVEDFNSDGLPDVVATNSGSNDVSILLSGKAVVPSITLSADAIQFSDEKRNELPLPKTLTLSNIGLGPLTITDVVLEGPGSQAFSVKHESCSGETLTTGKLCVMDISFLSDEPGTHRAQLTIWDNAAGGPRVVTLSGRIKG